MNPDYYQFFSVFIARTGQTTRWLCPNRRPATDFRFHHGKENKADAVNKRTGLWVCAQVYLRNREKKPPAFFAFSAATGR